MKSAYFILVMGLPGSGKTTISKQIAKELSLPLISRDDIKMYILDNVGWKDRAWSKKIGKASFDILDYVIEQQCKSGRPFIIESDFTSELVAERFQKYMAENSYNAVQIICHAQTDTLISRWKNRAIRDARHPSSTEGEEGLNDLLANISNGPRKALEIAGQVIELDTTDFLNVNTNAVIEQIHLLNN